MKQLLICIAFHYNKIQLQYLIKVLDNFFDNYNIEFDIIIDSNKSVIPELSGYDVEIIAHPNQAHPFHLTWQHRKHVFDNIDNYENFMYVEDDMLIPFENYLNYLENFKLLFPKYVPSFIRIENYEGVDYITDVTKIQSLLPINTKGKQFAKLNEPYHAFWIMPQKELKETMISNFVRLSDSRETASTYIMWELRKTGLVEIENNQISSKCYSYHLSNNYARSKESIFAKIEPNKIFK